VPRLYDRMDIAEKKVAAGRYLGRIKRIDVGGGGSREANDGREKTSPIKSQGRKNNGLALPTVVGLKTMRTLQKGGSKGTG